MHRMARAMGVSIGQAVRDGDLSAEASVRMACHCEACGEAATCRKILRAAGTEIAAPPAFCANRSILTWLRGVFQRKPR
jgi:hypothetical protein